MIDMLELVRIQRFAEINVEPKSRQALGTVYGRVWDTDELRAEFDVIGFMAPFVGVRRKSDGRKGSLEFQHHPRFYFSFVPDRPYGPLPVVNVSENLTLSPSSIDLSRGETQFIAETGREYILHACLQQTALPADTAVILDCPPSLGVLSINCFTAATHLCIVIQPGGFELRTLVHLNETVAVLQQRTNPALSIAGAVITNCHLRRSITEEVHAEVARHYAVLGQIRADARLLYATTSGKVYYLTRSKALDDYRMVVSRLRAVLPWLKNR
jgi:chromosome partitioning protein